MNNINDFELISLLSEESEVVKEVIYNKYKCLIDIAIKKYNNIIKALQIDINDVYIEALYAFNNAIISFDVNKEASLKTFIFVCIERKIENYIYRHSTKKHNMLYNSLSIDYVNEDNLSFVDILSDNNKNNPLNNIEIKETFYEMNNIAKLYLSKNEYEVYKYIIEDDHYQVIAMKLGKTPKQIDNTIQRIKHKLKSKIHELNELNKLNK